jgi:plastocyanin
MGKQRPLSPVYAVALLGTMLAALACGSDDEESPGDGAEDGATPQEVEVAARDFAFAPTNLTGAVGEPIEITLTNTGETLHTFTIDEYNVDVEVPAGEKATFDVLPSEPGEFNYYCRFHQAQGMFGAISTTGEGVGDEAGDEPTSAPDDDPYIY